jgi:hypothetical protein
MSIFQNNSFLPVLIEYWVKEEYNTILDFNGRKCSLKLKGLILKANSKKIVDSVNEEYYISSIFGPYDIENNIIWLEKKLKSEMHFFITDTIIDNKSKLFDYNFYIENGMKHFEFSLLENIV